LDFLPAGGQGIIVLQIRADDEKASLAVGAINHRETLSCLEAEREFLRLLQGDCGSPVGVLATITDSTITIRAEVFEPSRVEPRSAQVEGDASTPKKVAAELWKKING
jgi:hydroxymethylbilane synthase